MTSNQKVFEEYERDISYEAIAKDELNEDKVDGLKEKEGLVIETDTTDLWIRRSLSLQKFMNQVIVMESALEYDILDSFGTVITTTDNDGVIEFIKGWFEESSEY